MQTKCPYCNDTGLKDSGGETPWGDEILVPCICEAGDEAYEFQKRHLTPFAPDKSGLALPNQVYFSPHIHPRRKASSSPPLLPVKLTVRWLLMADNDITKLVSFGENDGEFLPLEKCVCGQEFESWDFILSIYRDNPKTCPKCGRQLYFSVSVRVLEVAPPNTACTPTKADSPVDADFFNSQDETVS